MKSLNKLKGVLLPAVMMMAALNAQGVFAGSYASVVNLPVLHAKGYAYRANIPLPTGPRAGQTIKHVSWSWNVHGWPRGLQVFLCQSDTECIDVSKLRSGATTNFNNLSATKPFFYQLRLSPSGPAPIAGEKGRITVTWN